MLSPDMEVRLKRATSRLVPDGPAVPGYKLTVTGSSPFSYGWQQDDDKEILVGNGDPNGVHTAPKGRLYVERDVPALWLNDDGEMSWVLVGGAPAPVALDYLQANAATPTGIASGTIESLDWTVDAPNTVGTDISVVANVVTINAPGIYAVETSFGAQAESDPDTYTRYVGLLDVEPNEVGRPSALMTDVQAPGSHAGGHYGNSSFTWVGFLPAGAEFDVTVQMDGDAGVDWDVLYGWIQVHRIG